MLLRDALKNSTFYSIAILILWVAPIVSQGPKVRANLLFTTDAKTCDFQRLGSERRPVGGLSGPFVEASVMTTTALQAFQNVAQKAGLKARLLYRPHDLKVLYDAFYTLPEYRLPIR